MMNSLKALERDVEQFLSGLAHVRRVAVEASVTSNGKKTCHVTTFITEDNVENRVRVYDTEQIVADRHSSVLFNFHCTKGS